MTKVVARYSHTSSDDNRLLLLALTEAWGEKCYWCRKPKLFRELQIDHIVPRRPHGGTATDRDVDAVDNLAPICGPCNQEKSNGEFQNTPRVESQIELAAKRAATVQRTLDSFRRDAQVTKALLAITAADLNDERVAGAVEALGVVVLSVLRKRFPDLLDARFAEDLTVQRPPVEYEGRLFRVDDGASVIELDGKSRRAFVILEDVLGISLRYALDVAGRDVIDGVRPAIWRRCQRGDSHAARFATPSAVTLTLRGTGPRVIQPSSKSLSVIAVPSGPARWCACSVQSMQ